MLLAKASNLFRIDIILFMLLYEQQKAMPRALIARTKALYLFIECRAFLILSPPQPN